MMIVVSTSLNCCEFLHASIVLAHSELPINATLLLFLVEEGRGSHDLLLNDRCPNLSVFCSKQKLALDGVAKAVPG